MQDKSDIFQQIFFFWGAEKYFYRSRAAGALGKHAAHGPGSFDAGGWQPEAALQRLCRQLLRYSRGAACKWYGSCASARGGTGNWEQMLTISCRTTCRPVQKVTPSKKTQFKKSTLKDCLTWIGMSLQPVDVSVACGTSSWAVTDYANCTMSRKRRESFQNCLISTWQTVTSLGIWALTRNGNAPSDARPSEVPARPHDSASVSDGQEVTGPIRGKSWKQWAGFTAVERKTEAANRKGL